MNVSELIQALEGYPPEAEVGLHIPDFGMGDSAALIQTLRQAADGRVLLSTDPDVQTHMASFGGT